MGVTEGRVGVRVTDAVGEGDGVRVAVDVDVAVAVAVGVSVAVGVRVGVGVAIGVAVAKKPARRGTGWPEVPAAPWQLPTTAMRANRPRLNKTRADPGAGVDLTS